MKNEKLITSLFDRRFWMLSLVLLPFITRAQNENDYFIDREYQEGPFQVDQRTISPDQWKKFQSDDDFWYANATFKKDKKAQPTTVEKEKESGRT